MTLTWRNLALVAAMWLVVLAVVHAEAPKRDLDFQCQVTRIIDGDTWACDGMVARVRAFGYDSPDFACRGRRHCTEDKPAAHAAREYLKALIGKQPLDCVGKDFDKYGRIVAMCRVNGRDIGCAMIRAGHGIEMLRYSGGIYSGCKPAQ